MFRSGAANEEFDGLARYSELKMAVGNLGGTARSSRPMFGMGLIFWWNLIFLMAIWVVPRERKARPNGMSFPIFIM